MTKNILFLLTAITAILTMGAGCVKRDIVDNQSNEVVSQELPTAQASLPTTCTDKQEGIPVITSLSSYAGPVGTKLEIKGCNFAGFEGDKNAWIENSQGIKGILYGDAGSTGGLLKITLKSPLCQKDVSYSGLPCDAPLILAPGIYKIYTMPWGKKSNKVVFTINTNSDSITEIIKGIFASKYKKPISEVTINISKLSGFYLAGSVVFGKGGEAEAGAFLAVKTNDKWEVVYDGNGSVDCNLLQDVYKFPKNILTNFCD